MKDLKFSLKKVSGELKKIAKEVEKISGKLDGQKQVSARPTKKTAAKRARKTVYAKQPTAADTVFRIVKRSRKGVNLATIKEKTGYNDKKIQNIVFKLKKQGKVKSETRGLYVTM